MMTNGRYSNTLKVVFLTFAALFLGCAGGGTTGTSGTHSRALFSLITADESDLVIMGDVALATGTGDIVGTVPLDRAGKVEFNTNAGDVTLSLLTNTNQHSVVLNKLENQGSILLLRGNISSSSVEFNGDSYEFALRSEPACRKFFTEDASLYLSASEDLPNDCFFELVLKKNGDSLPGAIVNFYKGGCELPSAYSVMNKVSELVTDQSGTTGTTAELGALKDGNCYTFQALVNESGREDFVLQVLP